MQPKIKTKNMLTKVNIGLLILLIGSFLMRLVFANMSANQSYELSQYDQQIKTMRYDHEQLVLSAAELQSIERLNAVSAQLSLVRADKVYYLQPKASVAINR